MMPEASGRFSIPSLSSLNNFHKISAKGRYILDQSIIHEGINVKCVERVKNVSHHEMNVVIDLNFISLCLLLGWQNSCIADNSFTSMKKIECWNCSMAKWIEMTKPVENCKPSNKSSTYVRHEFCDFHLLFHAHKFGMRRKARVPNKQNFAPTCHSCQVPTNTTNSPTREKSLILILIFRFMGEDYSISCWFFIHLRENIGVWNLYHIATDHFL